VSVLPTEYFRYASSPNVFIVTPIATTGGADAFGMAQRPRGGIVTQGASVIVTDRSNNVIAQYSRNGVSQSKLNTEADGITLVDGSSARYSASRPQNEVVTLAYGASSATLGGAFAGMSQSAGIAIVP
jgi:hypothetical protein